MQSHATPAEPATRRHRPKTLTVFAAAFAAGAVLAYGVNRVVDVHVVQVEPQVESEPIFVALRTLPQGSPITVWDVALKDWPKALLPVAALKADTSFEGMVLRHPVREGQPLLSVQLVRDDMLLSGSAIAAVPAARPPASVEQFQPAAPAEPPSTAAVGGAPAVTARPAAEPAQVAAAPLVTEQVVVEPTPAAADLVAIAPLHEEPAAAAEPVPTAAPETQPQAGEWQIAAVAEPTSPDIDAPVAAAPVAEPTLAPVEVPTEVAAAAVRPLAAPVPALPSTDLGRSLADVGRSRSAPAGQPTSVLDRTFSAEPPAAVQAAPKQHLVVPERIALAVDASFTQQAKPQPAATTSPQPQQAQQRQQPQRAGATPSRGVKPQAAAPQARAGSRKSAATPAATPSSAARRQQPNSNQPAAKQQPTPPRGLSAWLPQFTVGRAASQSASGKTERR